MSSFKKLQLASSHRGWDWTLSLSAPLNLSSDQCVQLHLVPLPPSHHTHTHTYAHAH